jgi:hypothetical protein
LSTSQSSYNLFFPRLIIQDNPLTSTTTSLSSPSLQHHHGKGKFRTIEDVLRVTEESRQCFDVSVTCGLDTAGTTTTVPLAAAGGRVGVLDVLGASTTALLAHDPEALIHISIRSTTPLNLVEELTKIAETKKKIAAKKAKAMLALYFPHWFR